ncbi:MAG: MjaI family restriction endonuclease, partial [Candidatus Aminicenantes bacterium]|nr:MjaI family restriction endonuclease [Candidatus Aminicenantes bacterium]
MKVYSKSFGKKEKVLNYTNQTYQLSRPNKVGAVMSLIRKCQPKSIEEWEKWYLANAYTAGKKPAKVTKDVLKELGERLYVKIKEIVIPEWQEAFNQLTLQDCIDYIYNLTINRTYDGFNREKSVVT